MTSAARWFSPETQMITWSHLISASIASEKEPLDLACLVFWCCLHFLYSVMVLRGRVSAPWSTLQIQTVVQIQTDPWHCDSVEVMSFWKWTDHSPIELLHQHVQGEIPPATEGQVLLQQNNPLVPLFSAPCFHMGFIPSLKRWKSLCLAVPCGCQASKSTLQRQRLRSVCSFVPSSVRWWAVLSSPGLPKSGLPYRGCCVHPSSCDALTGVLFHSSFWPLLCVKCYVLHSDWDPTVIFLWEVELIHPLITAVHPKVFASPPPTNPSILSGENSEHFSEMEGGDDADRWRSHAHGAGRGRSISEHQCTSAAKAVSLQEKPAPPPQWTAIQDLGWDSAVLVMPQPLVLRTVAPATHIPDGPCPVATQEPEAQAPT